MLTLLRTFMSVFGRGYGTVTALVLVGGILVAILETLGILLIFPLMHLVLDPAGTVAGGTMATLYRLAGTPAFPAFIAMVSVAIGAVYVFKSLFQIGFSRWEFKVLSRWKAAIATRFFEKFLDADYSYHCKRNSASLITMISQNIVIAINNFVHQVIMLISQMATAIFIFSFLLIHNPTMTVSIIMFFVVLFKGQSFLIRRKLERLSQVSVALAEENMFALQQGLGAYKETKINLKEKFFRNMFDTANMKMMDAEGSLLFFRSMPIYTNEMIVMLVTIVAFNMIVAVGHTGKDITADLAVTVMTLFRFIPIVNRSLTAVSFMSGAVHYVRQLIDEARIVRYEAPIPAEADQPEAMALTHDLALRHLGFTYPDTARPALDDIDLTIGRGEFVGVIGPSGSGKTTLIAMVSGFIEPDRGEYRIDGHLVDHGRIRALRRTIGYVDQQPFIFGGTVMENVAFGVEKGAIDRAQVEVALRQAELWAFVAGLAEGMDAPVGEDGRLFSGGQRQRLAIARALYKRPQILILDEATSALDIETERRFTQTVQNLKGQLTIIAIAHRLSTLSACDRLILMEAGRIVDEGRYDVLLDRSATFRRLVRNSQPGQAE
jgi:ATP-binding cassette subfamily C protein